MTAKSSVALEKTEKIPPRERILAAAAELFYRNGIRAVGVDAIAEAAGTNKMTLYRHFASKDELVAEYLRAVARKAKPPAGNCLQAQHPGDPLAQLRAWLKEMSGHVVSRDERGCPLANAAVELPDKDHPARRVIEECKVATRDQGDRALPRGRPQRAGVACRRAQPDAGRRARHRAERRHRRARACGSSA